MVQVGLLEDQAFTYPTPNQTFTIPILVTGGSTSAYSATLGALQAGAQVCLVQPQVVLGGQFTAQALPVSDDSQLLRPRDLIPNSDRDPQQLANAELFAISRSQRLFRERQRQLQPVAGQVVQNPGGGWVSNMAVHPITASLALNEAILPWLRSGQLILIPLASPTQVLFSSQSTEHRRVIGVVFQQKHTNVLFTVHAKIVIEATDLGDLLTLGQIESRIGQEARHETGEDCLPLKAKPNCQQAITHCAVIEKTELGQEAPIDPPPDYDQQPWLKADQFTSVYWFRNADQSAWKGAQFFDLEMGIFRYRRVYRSALDLQTPPLAGDVTVLNWGTSALGINGGPPQDPRICEAGNDCCGDGNDYRFGQLVGVSTGERQLQMQRAKHRTQAYIHFLQTHGISNLKLRGDLTWTEDGLALEPYIREARRGVALTTVRHQDVAKRFFPVGSARARTFADTVGIGHYHYLDFHPNHAPGHVELQPQDREILPFTLPLGALIPKDTDGLILSAKSIGTTHITNAAYRMHPIEWAIGEAGGHLAAFALQQGITVRQVQHDRDLTCQLQGQLAHHGIPIVWFNDVSHNDEDFEAIQVLAAAAIVGAEDTSSLHFKPEGTVLWSGARQALTHVLNLKGMEAKTSDGVLPATSDRLVTRQQFCDALKAVAPNFACSVEPQINPRPLIRRELARMLYDLLQLYSCR